MSIHEDVTWERLRAAVRHLPYLGSKWSRIEAHFQHPHELLRATADELVAIRGVGYGVANAIVRRLQDLHSVDEDPPAAPQTLVPQSGLTPASHGSTLDWRHASALLRGNRLVDELWPRIRLSFENVADLHRAGHDELASRLQVSVDDALLIHTTVARRLACACPPTAVEEGVRPGLVDRDLQRRPSPLYPAATSAFVVHDDLTIVLDDDFVWRVPYGLEPFTFPGCIFPAVGGNRHGHRGYRSGCQCPRCTTAYSDHVGVVALRIAGWTLDDIGNEVGLTRERVRQITVREAPWKPWDAVATEHRAAQQAVKDAKTSHKSRCVTCGEVFEVDLAWLSRRRYCTADCRQAYDVLRYHVDEGRRQKHRVAIAEWVLRNADRVQGFQYRYARRVALGDATANDRNRWLVQGSESWRVAVDACERDLPLFHLLPLEIRRQVQTALGFDVEDEAPRRDTLTPGEARALLDNHFNADELR